MQSDWHYLYQENYQPHDFRELRVEGELPSDLFGLYAQNGPRNIGNYQNLVLAESLIRAVRFKNGKAHGAILAFDTAEPDTHYDSQGNISSWRKKLSYLMQGRAPVKNMASTSLLRWQQQWLTLYEVSRPIQLDMSAPDNSVETDLQGVVKASFSAHPHHLKSRKANYNFGTRIGLRGSWLDIYKLPDHGEAENLISINLQRHCLGFIHDFAVTENYLVFVIPAIDMGIAETLALVRGESPFEAARWRKEMGSEILVVPIDESHKYQRFQCQAFFPLHFANGFEQGGKIVIDYGFNADTGIYKLLGKIHHCPELTQLEQEFPQFMQQPHDNGRLQRCTLDVKTGQVDFEFLSEQPIEFPRINENQQGQDYRYLYCLSNDEGDRLSRPWFSSYRKVDLKNPGADQVYTFPAACFGLEPCFVPRADPQSEDDGYVLACMLDAEKQNSYLAIFDGQNFKDGPIAKVHFDQPLPIAFHGVFAPEV